MKRAFTLVELMAVVFMAGLLGTISIVAWGAVTKGVADRAAHAALRSFLQSAAGVVETEGVRVTLRFASHTIDGDEYVAGATICRATAVKPVGRVSRVESGEPWDEFADEGPVRLKQDEGVFHLVGDAAEWNVGEPYCRIFATLELPMGYFVGDGEFAIVPSADGKASANGSAALKVIRPDGSVEQVGEPVTIGDSEREG